MITIIKERKKTQEVSLRKTHNWMSHLTYKNLLDIKSSLNDKGKKRKRKKRRHVNPTWALLKLEAQRKLTAATAEWSKYNM